MTPIQVLPNLTKRQTTRPTLPQKLLLAGLLGWAGTVLAAVLTSASYPLFPFWLLANAVFLAAFLWNARAPAKSLTAIAAQSASVIVMVLLLCNGYEGLLLVVVAAELALQATASVGFAWVIVQSLSLGVAITIHWSFSAALLVSVPYFGFQVLTFSAVRLFVEERTTRERLADTNETLIRLQTEIVNKSRVEERLRIAQDLHDSLGHRLVALGLHLELAAHESHGTAHAAARTAQAMVRAALHEVKLIVRAQNDGAPVNLQQEIRRLAEELPRPKVHVDFTPDTALEDPQLGRALLRTAQEIVTNAIRHGEAHNLWIDVHRHGDRVILAARDDGQGSLDVSEGFGLSGMRRRLEELGGTLTATPSRTGGFEVRAEVPCAMGTLS
jgi:signal transduction histidine kinase